MSRPRLLCVNRTASRLLIGLGAAGALVACGGNDDIAAPQPAPIEAAGEPVVIDEAGMAAGEDVDPIETVSGPAYLGVWGFDEASCALSPGGGERAPIAITEGEFIGSENFCRIGHVEETGPMSWTIETICPGDGVEFTLIHTIAVDADGLTIANNESATSRLVRCPSA